MPNNTTFKIIPHVHGKIELKDFPTEVDGATARSLAMLLADAAEVVDDLPHQVRQTRETLIAHMIGAAKAGLDQLLAEPMNSDERRMFLDAIEAFVMERKDREGDWDGH